MYRNDFAGFWLACTSVITNSNSEFQKPMMTLLPDRGNYSPLLFILRFFLPSFFLSFYFLEFEDRVTEVLELSSKQARTHVKGFNYHGDLARWMDGARLGSDHLIAVFHRWLRFHPIARRDVAFISCHGAGSRFFAVRARYQPRARLVFYRTNRHLRIYVYGNIRILFMNEKMKRKRKRRNVSFLV